MVVLTPIEVSLTSARIAGLTLPIEVNLAQGHLGAEHGTAVLNLNINVSVPLESLIARLSDQEPHSPEVAALRRLAEEAPGSEPASPVESEEVIPPRSSSRRGTSDCSISIHESMASRTAPSSLIGCGNRRINSLYAPQLIGSESGEKPEVTHPPLKARASCKNNLDELAPTARSEDPCEALCSAVNVDYHLAIRRASTMDPQNEDSNSVHSESLRQENMWSAPVDMVSFTSERSAASTLHAELSNLWEDESHRDAVSGDLTSLPWLANEDEDEKDLPKESAVMSEGGNMGASADDSARLLKGAASCGGAEHNRSAPSRSADLPVAFRPRDTRSTLCPRAHATVGELEVMKTLSNSFLRKYGARNFRHISENLTNMKCETKAKTKMSFVPGSPHSANGSPRQHNMEDLGAQLCMKYGEQLCVQNVSKDVCLWSIRAGLKKIVGDLLVMQDCKSDAKGDVHVTFESAAAARQACARLSGQTLCGSPIEVHQVCQA